MAWSFRKRIKRIPGVHLNLSKSISTSIEVKGANLTFGKSGTYFIVFLVVACFLYACQNSDTTNNSLAGTDTSISGVKAKDVSKKQTTKADSLKLKALRKYFVFKADEFATDHKTWIKPKDAPQFINQNAVYCYFESTNGVANNLRFSIQYYSDDWLFIKRYLFSIDGKAYEYYPNKVETDSGNGGHIWEWFDDQVDESSKEILQALENSKTAKVKMTGRQYFDVKKITAKQIASLKRTLDLYHLMGGI